METCVQNLAEGFQAEAFVCSHIGNTNPCDVPLSYMLDTARTIYKIMDLSFKYGFKVLLHGPTSDLNEDPHVC